MAITLSNDHLRGYLRHLGHEAEPGRLHLLGMRSASPTTGATISIREPQPNRYDDTILTFGTELMLFRGTVDPGATWARKPMNPEGCAHLLGLEDGGYPYEYRLGLHRGHPALVQAGMVKVRRDRDRDGRDEKGEPVRTGFFGINLHAGGTSPNVNDYSAGCQVIAGGWSGLPWTTFYHLCKMSGQTRFLYFLVDGAKFALWFDGERRR